MALKATIEKAIFVAEKLKAAGNGNNEANTKALLIEPMLAELGWDVTDLDQVVREYKVYDSTFLDYALKIDGELRVFVEAKAVAKDLGDKQFVAQTVNYANNEGVIWCVLTNGLAYRVYKTNEPVGMEQKLLFEVDLTDIGDDGGDSVSQGLALFSRSAVAEGKLDTWGERVFTDTRVRRTLTALAADPNPDFLSVIEKKLGLPSVTPDQLKQSLARVLDAGQVTTVGKGSVPPPEPSATPGGKGKEYKLEHHTIGIPAAIVDLFEQLDEFGRGLGPDVSRRIRKQYIGSFGGPKGRSFFTVELKRQRVLIYLALDPVNAKPWSPAVMRDARDFGHYGMGDLEYSLSTGNQLNDLRDLIEQAYKHQ